jgi:hypothetical protein
MNSFLHSIAPASTSANFRRPSLGLESISLRFLNGELLLGTLPIPHVKERDRFMHLGDNAHMPSSLHCLLGDSLILDIERD